MGGETWLRAHRRSVSHTRALRGLGADRVQSDWRACLPQRVPERAPECHRSPRCRESSRKDRPEPAALDRSGEERALHLVEHPTPPVTQVALLCLALAAGSITASAQQAPRVPRVRSENPWLAAAIGRGVDQSPMFRRLIEAIDTTDGLVYILEGKCGEGVRACLHMSLELAGPYSLLRILVNPRLAPGCELIASTATNFSTLWRHWAIRASGPRPGCPHSSIR